MYNYVKCKSCKKHIRPKIVGSVYYLHYINRCLWLCGKLKFKSDISDKKGITQDIYVLIFLVQPEVTTVIHRILFLWPVPKSALVARSLAMCRDPLARPIVARRNRWRWNIETHANWWNKLSLFDDSVCFAVHSLNVLKWSKTCQLAPIIIEKPFWKGHNNLGRLTGRSN